MSSAKFAYYKAVPVGTGAWAAGLLVVDARGLPVDFRYSDVVAPGKVHQLLYGKALERHVRRDVLFRALCERIDAKPDALFVDDEQLLDLNAGAPLALVGETRVSPLREANDLMPMGDGEWLWQPYETGSPLRLKVGKPEANAGERLALALAEGVRHGLDPAEPYARVKAAILELCAEPGAESQAPAR